MDPSRLKTADEVLAEGLERNPEFRRKWERTTVAREIANMVIRYRIEHNLTQTALARLLGMYQPAIARLELGEHEPSLATLSRLARVLGMEFHIDITRNALRLSA